ncbi:MAG: exo-beta-N-acetylmuramidase NamZ family protein [Gemmatimonadaceae bacterium]
MIRQRVIPPYLRAAALPLLAGGCLTVAAAHGAQRPRVRLGVDVLLSDSLHVIRGKRVGLITNHTGRDAEGVSTIDRLARTSGVRLTALYGPEHGLRGLAKAGEHVASGVDSATGVPIHSLYGETRAPTAAMLQDVDVLVYDIQDVGARVYTYPWTMALAAEAASKAGKPFVVLDRPDPVRADRVEGGVLDPKFRSFVGAYPVALRYGLTIGELARHLVRTQQLDAAVHVIPMQNYTRAQWWDETGLVWVNPSPNIRSLDAALLYTGTVFFEGTNLSEGRGTDAPFQLIGAGWLNDAGLIARELNGLRLAGVHFDSTSRAIEAGYKWGGQTIPMIHVTVTQRDAVQPVAVGMHLLRAMYRRHSEHWQWRSGSIDRLAGSDRLRGAVEREGGIEALLPVLQREAAAFERLSALDRIYR